MTKLQHTPGPWKIDLKERTVRSEDSSILFDDSCYNYNDNENMAADARLIAAAPEMLEALINEANNQIIRAQVVKNIDDFIKNIGKTKIMQLIERATGLNIEEVLKCTE